MEISQLKSFVRVAESRSLSKAARVLFISQPTLTSRIRALEKDLETDLFERGGGPLRLSPAGELLLPLVRDALKALMCVKSAARDYRAGSIAPAVVVAASMTLSRCFLPKCLPLFFGRHPHVPVSIATVNGPEVYSLVRGRTAHLGLVRLGRELSADLVYLPLYSSPLVPVARPGHPLVDRRVQLSDISRYPCVTFGEESVYWGALVRWFQQYAFWPRSFVRLNHILTMEEMVLRTDGVSFLPSDVLDEDLVHGRVRRIDIIEPPPSTSIGLVRLKGPEPGPALSQLIACLREQASSTVSAG